MVRCPECGADLTVAHDETPTVVLVSHLDREHGWFAEPDGGFPVPGGPTAG